MAVYTEVSSKDARELLRRLQLGKLHPAPAGYLGQQGPGDNLGMLTRVERQLAVAELVIVVPAQR